MKTSTRKWQGWLIGFLMLASSAQGEVVQCPNGITALIHTATDIGNSWLDNLGDRSYVRHPALGLLELFTGPDDPRLPRRDGETFVPYDPAEVGRALAAMHDIQPRIHVEIFLLPMPPVVQLGSFTREGVVVLSPGFGPLLPSSTAYTVTHEMGHVLTWAYLDQLPSRWQTYRDLRGLASSSAGYGSSHADQIREILAEDTRYLFGGALATVSGTIENHRLTLPDQVRGLRELLTSYFQGNPLLALDSFPSEAVPNPCNPVTTIQMRLPPDLAINAATLTIYDVRGRLICGLRGSAAGDGQVRVTWDGRDSSGRPAASGRYCYHLRVGGFSSRGVVLLVR